MVGSNKILTVSYGTFSCTLEGFDQPFVTMKSIAEYFRDLAADDRYFGAEPPQPDAEMLHRIAEREVHRRVEARVEKNGVFLRQTADATTGDASPHPLPSRTAPPAPQGADRRPSTPRDDNGDNAPFDVDIDGDSVAAKLSRIRAVVARARANREADTDFAEDEPTEAYVTDARDGAFAGPVGNDPDSGDFTSEAAVEDDSEPHLTATDMAQDLGNEDVGTGSDSIEDIAPEIEDILPEVAGDIPQEPTTALASDAEVDTDAPETAGDSVAPETAGDSVAPETAGDLPSATTDKRDAEAADGIETMTATASPDFAPDLPDDAMTDDETDMTGLAPQPIETPNPEVELLTDVSGAPDAVGGEQARDAQDLLDAGEHAPVAEMDQPEDESPVAAADEPEQSVAMADHSDLPEGESAAGDDPEAPIRPAQPHARIIKLKRKEFEAALAAGEIEEIDDDESLEDSDDVLAEIDTDSDEILDDLDDADRDNDTLASVAGNLFDADDAGEAPDSDAPQATSDDDGEGEGDEDAIAEGIRDLIGQTSLDADDEEDLLAELADVERDATATARDDHAEARARFAEFFDDDTEDEADEGETAEEDSAEEAARTDEQALNRLLDTTNAKLNDTEGSRRRSAIAHLKAAVAATRADRFLKGRAEKQASDNLNQFRDDLAQVVRPRRPAAPTGTDDSSPARDRPADLLAARPAPLVLVSEQRVDQPADTTGPVTPVRPRRVARGGQADAPQSADEPAATLSSAATAERVRFSDFAESRGARELPDVLEAAAAYVSEIEGQPQMSRPQILRRAASLDPESTISREQGLQSFGQLLRSGRIRKVGLGKFALADEVPDNARKAASGQ